MLIEQFTGATVTVGWELMIVPPVVDPDEAPEADPDPKRSERVTVLRQFVSIEAAKSKKLSCWIRLK